MFAWGPLPGERARVRITAVKPKYAVADVVELLERSPDRVDPVCPLFGTCGGCQLQHLAYPAQLAWKQSVVRSALARIGALGDVAVSAPIGMDVPLGYRNKAALVVRDDDGSVELGFYQARSHDVVAVERCPVVTPLLDEMIAGLWKAARDPEAAAAFADARHVVTRVATASPEAVVSITTERRSAAVARSAAALHRMLPHAVGISNSYEPSGENAVMGRKQQTVFGRPEIEEDLGGLRLGVSAPSFFQVNSAMVGRIFEHMRPLVQPGRRIVDLYCGAGTFSLFFAACGAEVVGVEENGGAVREARANAERNALSGKTSFVAGKVENVRQAGSPAAAAIERADVVFLDPPRKGSDEGTLAAIAAAEVPEVWYLSCNPSTLARDLALLVAAGYVLGAVQPFDMFPQTGHVEALALLRRAVPAAPKAG